MNTREHATDPQQLARLFISRARIADIDGIVELYEDGAVFAPDGSNVVSGHAQIREAIAKFLASRTDFTVSEQRPAMISGDLALTSARLPDGRITAEVARRQPDGSWRWVIDQPAIAHN